MQVPNVRFKELGAGWGMAVVAAIVSGFALVALTISYMTTRTEKRAIKKAMRIEDENSRRWESDY